MLEVINSDWITPRKQIVQPQKCKEGIKTRRAQPAVHTPIFQRVEPRNNSLSASTAVFVASSAL